MTLFTKQDFGKFLLQAIEKSTNVQEVSRQTYELYLDHGRNFEPGLYEIVQGIMLIELGSEFQYSFEELSEMAIKLIQSEQRAIRPTRNWHTECWQFRKLVTGENEYQPETTEHFDHKNGVSVVDTRIGRVITVITKST